MIKIKTKYVFIIFILNLFFLGLTLSWIISDGLNFENGKELFKKLSPSIAPFLTSIALFIELYIRRKNNVA